MGCVSSRSEGAKGSGFPMPFKARSTATTPTLSKKDLLLHKEDQDHVLTSTAAATRMHSRKKSSSFDHENESCVTSEGTGARNEKLDGNFESDDDDQYIEERMVRRKDEGFPGSPSFRIYFNDNLQDINKLGPGEDMVIQEVMAMVDDAHKVEAKRSNPVAVAVVIKGELEKKEKRGGGSGSFKKIKGGGQAAMKNIRNVGSSILSPRLSITHHRGRLLTPIKTTPAAHA